MWWTIIIFMVVLIGMGMTTKQPPRKKKKTASKRKPVLQAYKADDGVGIEIDWPSTFLEIEWAIKKGDYDFARIWLQKFSYTTVDKNVPQWVRDRFKTLMTAFAKQDPLYLRLIGKIQPLVDAQPGILQTALYPQLPDFSEEQIRYALYFAHELGDLNRLKKGRSYQVFGPIGEMVIKPGEKIGATIAKTDIVIRKNPIDERIAALHRKATRYKEEDWNKAVACLQEATDLMRRHGGGYGIERWLRLPVFLQQAGCFTEAEKEFMRLIKETPARVKRESHPGVSANRLEYREHLDLKHIYNKMRMAYKREKRPIETAQYAAMSLEHGELAEALWDVLEIEREQERLAYAARRIR
jgi:hypothetical protein